MPRSPSPTQSTSHRAKDIDSHRDRRRSRSPARRHDDRDARDRSRSPHRRSRDDRDKSDRKDRDRRDRSRSRSRSPRRRSDRDRSRSRSRDRTSSTKHRSSRRRSRSRSRSPSGSSSDGSEDSRRHSKKKRSHRSREEREEKKRRIAEKKERKEAKARKKAGLGAPVEWGKHGIIAAEDIYSKDQEFRAWLVGERMINPETLSKAKEKDIFKEFMEDFNTGTLPHEKYYNMDKYEKKMDAIRSGETVVASDRYDPNADLESIKASHRRAPVETETFLDKSRLEALRRVQSERVEMERMKKLGIKDFKDSFGVIMESKKESEMRR